MKFINFLREQTYRLGLQNSIRLKGFTISVGNLSVGGTGKSPLVQEIVAWVLSCEKIPLVLSRGYGRSQSDLAYLAPGELPQSVEQVGDESAMLKGRYPGCALLIHPDRAVRAQEKEEFPIIVLDDAFQHWRAFRDVDVVVWDVTESLEQATLPWGRLRESVQALARADLLVLTRVDEVSADDLGHRIQSIQRLLASLQREPYRQWPWRIQRQANAWPPKIFLTRHKATGLFVIETQELKDPSVVKGRKVLLVSGIGRPASFQKSVARAGAEVLDALEFPDHHAFTEMDIQKIRTRWLQLEKPQIITTEKDFYRSSEVLSQLVGLQYWQVGIDFVQAGRQDFFRDLEERMRWARS